jgi:hypothetical protein
VRVVASTIDQGGFATAQELSSHKIHSWRTNDAAVMTDHALAVENRQLEPGVIGPIADGPDNRFDFAAARAWLAEREAELLPCRIITSCSHCRARSPSPHAI